MCGFSIVIQTDSIQTSKSKSKMQRMQTAYQSLPSLSALSSTNSYAGLKVCFGFPASPSIWDFNAGLGCVSVVPPSDVYP